MEEFTYKNYIGVFCLSSFVFGFLFAMRLFFLYTGGSRRLCSAIFGFVDAGAIAQSANFARPLFYGASLYHSEQRRLLIVYTSMSAVNLLYISRSNGFDLCVFKRTTEARSINQRVAFGCIIVKLLSLLANYSVFTNSSVIYLRRFKCVFAFILL